MAEAMMNAIGIPVPGPYDALVLENRPRPVPEWLRNVRFSVAPFAPSPTSVGVLLGGRI